MEKNIAISTPYYRRLAVVTGGNKGIGFEICRQLASNGIRVILTARNESRGTEAVENLKNSGLDDLIFHQLDVKDPASVAKLAKFIKTNFNKLDILINNAAEGGWIINDQEFRAFKDGAGFYIHNEMTKLELQDVDNLNEEKIDEIVERFLRDFKANKLKENGWPITASAYKVSKAAVNAYTRLLSRKHLNILVNCVHPGYVITDITSNTGFSTPEQGARAPVMLALLPDGGPSGCYFNQMQLSSF